MQTAEAAVLFDNRTMGKEYRTLGKLEFSIQEVKSKLSVWLPIPLWTVIVAKRARNTSKKEGRSCKNLSNYPGSERFDVGRAEHENNISKKFLFRL